MTPEHMERCIAAASDANPTCCTCEKMARAVAVMTEAIQRDATRRSAIRIHAKMKREARASGDHPSARHHDREMQAIATDIAAEHIVDGVPIRLPVDAEKVLAVIASVLN